MRTVRIEPGFATWRARARELIVQGIPPEAVAWEEAGAECGSLFGDDGSVDGEARPIVPAGGRAPRIPRAFLELAERVACHRSPERWGRLYRVAWRLVRGGERGLLERVTDADMAWLLQADASVRRDRHKMKAFVRFRRVGEGAESDGSPRERFVAWFEPDHDIVELTAPFFARRFAAMDWSILTPRRCAHWDGKGLRFTDGVSREVAPAEDELEDYWRTYYAHIFNPARLKPKAMRAEMPMKYWRNLPEAPLIAELTREAPTRAMRLVDAPDSRRSHVSTRLPKGVPEREAPAPEVDPVEVLRRADDLTRDAIRDLAEGCRACPLHERATRVVFGEGPADAEILIVGEQPGDHEDLAGRPFVGPAGRLLDEALGEAGIERRDAYVTNVVKHFKWRRRGKRRLHETPAADEVHACRPWVLAEIRAVRPRVVILLGATAARALVRPDFALLAERGLVEGCPLAERVVATVHPAWLLRRLDGSRRDRERARWVEELRLARGAG